MKIFSVNFNKSINDKYGATATLGSTATVRNDEKGIALKCNSLGTDIVNYGNIAAINSIGTGEFSFVVGANVKKFVNHGSSFNILSAKGDPNVGGFAILVLSGSIRAYVATSYIEYITTSYLCKNNIYILTRNTAGLCTLYQNGISIGTLTQAGNISTTVPMSIGYDGSIATRTPNASIYLSEVYNHCLSETEIQKLTADFQAQYPIAKPKRGFMLYKPTDLSSQKDKGLIAAYNFVKNGNTLVDISGNGKNLTVTNGLVQTQNGLQSSTVVPSPFLSNTSVSITNGWSAVHRVYWNGTTSINSLFTSSGSHHSPVFRIGVANKLEIFDGVSLYSGAITLTKGFYTFNYGVLSNGQAFFKILGIDSITSSVGGIISPITTIALGNHQTIQNRSWNGEQIDFKMFNRILTDDEINAYSNSFVLPTLIDDLSTEPADNQVRVPREWEQISGTYKISEITTPDPVLKTITKGTKYLECVTAGTIAIPSNQAYGTWEFDWYKGADANRLEVNIIADRIGYFQTANGYYCVISTLEAIGISRNNVGSFSSLIATAASYITNNTWYRIKITRTTVGVFTVYIKGGAFVPTAGADGWTLVSITGGSGTNPVTDNTYTTSNYFVLDLDAGDRFANLVMKDGIIIN